MSHHSHPAATLMSDSRNAILKLGKTTASKGQGRHGLGEGNTDGVPQGRPAAVEPGMCAGLRCAAPAVRLVSGLPPPGL